MSSCRIRRQEKIQDVVFSAPFVTAFLLALSDYLITYTGIMQGMGWEANPLFAPYTQMGPIPYLLGGITFFSFFVGFILLLPHWMRSMVIGVWAASHLFGFSSWLAIYLHTSIYYSRYTFTLSILAGVAVFFTMWSFVRLRSCPVPLAS